MRSQGLAAPQAATFAAGVLLAVAVGAISLDGRRTHRPPAPAWLLLALLTVYVTAFFVCFLCSTALRGRQRLRGRADSIIVLGAGLEDGKITPLLAHRLDRAVALHRTLVAAGADPVFIVSGGQGADEEESEAEAMARHAVARGVPAERVHRENHSHNTDQNLTYSAVLLKLVGRTDRRVVVVSSDFHVMRVALIMDRLGLRGTVVGSRTKLPYWLTAALREFVAIVSYDRTATLGLTALLVLPATALALPWS
ncbi:YdcF family protein [Streptacidiphilus monticola]